MGVEDSSCWTKKDGDGSSEQVREANGRGKILRKTFTVDEGTIDEYSRSE